MGLALIAGVILARRQRYRAHAWCQSAVVLLNLVLLLGLATYVRWYGVPFRPTPKQSANSEEARPFTRPVAGEMWTVQL